MRHSIALLAAGCLTLAVASVMPSAVAAPAPDAAAADTEQAVALPDIPYTRFRLPNGLTVVVSEDHKAPVVAVSVWYHVGSSYEPAGKTGFAHLFEHLMFQGSENHEGEFFDPFEKVGATDMNGTTWLDRTNYFETVPTTALDMALWMESDRMGHLLGAIGQKQLDEQRGVVQNEKRQGLNQPYGQANTMILAHAFPANHGYHHTTIGSMDDLNAASLETVKKWFRDYYGAANATVALVGDITPETAKKKMLKYFGDIPAGKPVPRPQPWIAARDSASRDVITDNVPQVAIFREWNVPQRGSAAVPLLDLATTVLGYGKSSRLYQRLVYEDKLADSVSVSIRPHQLASGVFLRVMVKKGKDPARVEAAIADEWNKFLAEGPTAGELARAKTIYEAGFIRNLEETSGKAAMLAAGQVYQDDPGAWKTYFERTRGATPAAVQKAARQWLSRGAYTLVIKPGKTRSVDVDKIEGLAAEPGRPADKPDNTGDYHVVKSDVDRSKGVPAVTTFPDLTFPDLQHATLDNGIKVVLAERHAVPVVQVRMLFDAGYAADQGGKLGTSSFTMAMLDEGTDELDSVQIANRKQNLGARIDAGCSLDACSVSLNALKANLAPSLELYADVIREPAFRKADIERKRGQWIAGIAREKSRPMTMGLRVLPPLLFGKDHAYGIPLTGSGSVASIKSLTAADMRGFMHDWIRPDNVTLLVAGDTTLEQVLPKLNAAFGDWKAPATPVPDKNLAHVELPDHARVFLMDRPDAKQTLILAGWVAPSTKAADAEAIDVMNGAFGGTFTSRLNMNLREDKHWAYGARSFNTGAIGQTILAMYAPVQTDKTVPSIREVLKEARAVVGDKPLTEAEIVKIKNNDIRSLPGGYETTSAVLGAMTGIVKYDRPDDYVQTLHQRIAGVTLDEARAAAAELVHPDKLTWVIVGDLDRIGKPVRALDLGPVQVLDASGKPVEAAE